MVSLQERQRLRHCGPPNAVEVLPALHRITSGHYPVELFGGLNTLKMMEKSHSESQHAGPPRIHVRLFGGLREGIQEIEKLREWGKCCHAYRDALGSILEQWRQHQAKEPEVYRLQICC